MAMLMKAEKRSGMGTRLARKIRGQGRVPGIMYGHGQEPLAVTLALHDVEMFLHKKERVLEVDLQGQTQHVLVKEVQYDALGQNVLHVDMARVSLDERVEVTVPVVLRGVPAGAAEGGVLSQVMGKVRIECLVVAIPEAIRASVVELKLGDVLKVNQLPLPEGVKMLEDAEGIVATVRLIAEEVAAPAEGEAAAAAEPEVIGEKKEEAEGEEAAEGEKKPEKKAEKKE